MAKGKVVVRGAPKKTRKVKTKQIVRVPRPVGRAALDSAARQYAELIANPCGGKLTNTIWPGSSGGMVMRAETDNILFSGVTETAGVYVLCPGIVRGYTNNVSLTSDTLVTALGPAVGGVPGDTFLPQNAGSVRCVAACLQLSFPGSELDRSGIVSLGVVPLASLTNNITTASGGGNTSVSAANIRTMCQHTERTPQNMAEVTWFPGAGDMMPFQIGNPTLANNTAIDEASEKNCLVATVAGLKAGVGLRVRTVCVYEWIPSTGKGFVATVEPPRSNNTLTDILRYLPETKGTNWFINAWSKAQPYIRAAGSVISYGAKVIGPALMAL